MLTSVLFVIGLVLLVAGAEFLVRGASELAKAIGVPPLVIGLTVVAYGTSMPEFAVSVNAAYLGQADLALGNVVGSNIFNVLLILGVSALIVPLVVSRQLVRWDVPLMIGVSVAVYMMGRDGRIGRLDGVLLAAGCVAYTAWSIRQGRKEAKAARSEQPAAVIAEARKHWSLDALLIAVGLVMLVLGSRWLVNGAVVIAGWLGVSELVIGLTVVAAGTSLPEVATSIVAAVRGQRDIAVGNVVGSNIFNILCVLGFSAAINRTGVAVAPSALAFDIPVMIAVAVACLPIFFTGYQIARWEGLLFLAYYVAYTAYLVIAATHHPMLGQYRTAMVWFALPLTAVTLVVLSGRAWLQRPRHAVA